MRICISSDYLTSELQAAPLLHPTTPEAIMSQDIAVSLTPPKLDPREAWSRVAPGFDEFVTPLNMALGRRALDLAGIGADAYLLDVAAGSGALSIPAAQLGARVLATDISPVMMDRLSERTRRDGLTNVECRVMDGQALDLEPDTFDAAGSQFGVMLFPDMPAGIREMVRVTKPGGKVVIIAMGPPSGIDFLMFFLGALESTISGFPGLPKDPPPLPFQLADPQRFEKELAGVGLKDIGIHTVNHPLAFESGDHLWNWVTSSNPIAAGLVSDLTDQQHGAARAKLDEMIHERADGSDTATLNQTVHIGIGTK